MARSNKPILWLPFAAGGLVAALIIPVLILITGLLLPLGVVHLPYEKMAAFAHNPLGKLILFGAVAFPAWHAAHRLRMTAHDLGLGDGVAVKGICYGSAWVLIGHSAGADHVLPAPASIPSQSLARQVAGGTRPPQVLRRPSAVLHRAEGIQ